MKKVDVIIPCYRSEYTIKAVVNEIFDSIRDDAIAVRIVLVNDSSPDNVWTKITELCHEHSEVIGINLSRNFGQQSARMAALSYLEGDYVVFMDDDGQHDASFLPKMIEKIDEGFDIVYASFGSKKEAKWKSLGSDFHQLSSEFFEDKPKGIRTSSFFVLKRYVIETLRQYPSPSPVIFGYLMKTTQNIASIEVPHRARIEGKTGYTFGKLVRLWLNAVTSFSVIPLRLSSYLGFFSAIVGIITFFVIIIRKLLNPQIAAGYTSIVAVILLFAGIILLMLGLIGEYIGRMFMTINCVPQYVIKEVIGGREIKKDV